MTKSFAAGFFKYAVAKGSVNFGFKGDTMIEQGNQALGECDSRFKIFHELMTQKVRKILLISTPHDAWIMEKGCRLTVNTTMISI
jgi:hypothetical protein